MIPGSGLRQVIKGEDRMELTQVWWDISWLSVCLEHLHKSLGDCGSCSDVLWFRKESSGPNAIAFFKGFIREVKVGRAFRLGVGRQLGCCVGLIIFCYDFSFFVILLVLRITFPTRFPVSRH